MKSEFIPGLITIIGLLISFPVLRYYYLQGKKQAKGKTAPNIRLRKFKDIVTFSDWYNKNQEDIEDTWRVYGMFKIYTLDEFALELFKRNPEVTNRLKVI